MNHLDKIIEDSVQKYSKPQESKENEHPIPKKASVFKSNNQKKRKIEDDSSDDEEGPSLPRRRVMTLKEINKRKKTMTKYQRDLMKEHEEEKFFAKIRNEEYDDDSLVDFVVPEDSMFIDNQLMSSDNDVYTTSSFLRDNRSFVDDECEEDQQEVKDCFSDSEEEQMYLNAKGYKNFYDKKNARDDSFIDECKEEEERAGRKDCCSDSEEKAMYLEAKGIKRDDLLSSDADYLDDGETLSDSSEFTRNIQKKRSSINRFVEDEVSVDDEDLATSDLDDELIDDEDNGSDLDSFINDGEITLLENEEDTEEDESTNLDSSCFYKKKKRTKKVAKFDSSDEENESFEQSPQAITNSKHKSTNVLKTIENTSNRSLEINKSDSKTIVCKSPKKITKIQENETIILDSPTIVVQISSNTLVIEESDEETEIKSKKIEISKPLKLDNKSGNNEVCEDHLSSQSNSKLSASNNSQISNDGTNSSDPKLSSGNSSIDI